VCVASVGTGAAGVKLSLFKSGSSRDFRRRGLLLPFGDVGFELLGDICVGRCGMGRRRLGLREDGPLVEVDGDVCDRSLVFDALPPRDGDA
jgi:hypothetical protein